jgi:hypothetical protein
VPLPHYYTPLPVVYKNTALAKDGPENTTASSFRELHVPSSTVSANAKRLAADIVAYPSSMASPSTHVNAESPSEEDTKFDRRRRRSHGSPQQRPKNRPRLMSHKSIWLAPLLAECVFAFGAIWLAFICTRIVAGKVEAFNLPQISLIVGVYAVLAIYSKINDLFMPRAVVLFGVGMLMLITFTVSSYLFVEMVHSSGMSLRLLGQNLVCVVPVALFLLRGYLVFKDARYSPSLSSISIRANTRSSTMQRVSRRLKFWLS